jgi:hypothetical protein
MQLHRNFAVPALCLDHAGDGDVLVSDQKLLSGITNR